MDSSIIPYLVLDNDTEKLSIIYVNWDSANENTERTDFLKEQITDCIPHGVIVSCPRLEGNFYYDEWDAFNFIKFEIHSDFTDREPYLELKCGLRPLTSGLMKAIEKAFGVRGLSTSHSESDYSEQFAPTMKGWIDLYEKVVSIHNAFVDSISSIDNTPYYNMKNWWKR